MGGSSTLLVGPHCRPALHTLCAFNAHSLNPPNLLTVPVAPADLEDREAAEDDWTVGSAPQQRLQHQGSRVGALAAAAGRGASAFVEAFRSAMGAHRTSYAGRRQAGN